MSILTYLWSRLIDLVPFKPSFSSTYSWVISSDLAAETGLSALSSEFWHAEGVIMVFRGSSSAFMAPFSRRSLPQRCPLFRGLFTVLLTSPLLRWFADGALTKKVMVDRRLLVPSTVMSSWSILRISEDPRPEVVGSSSRQWTCTWSWTSLFWNTQTRLTYFLRLRFWCGSGFVDCIKIIKGQTSLRFIFCQEGSGFTSNEINELQPSGYPYLEVRNWRAC